LIERTIDKVVNRFSNCAGDTQENNYAGAKQYAPFPEVKVGR
jgi:hypothetical protein